MTYEDYEPGFRHRHRHRAHQRTDALGAAGHPLARGRSPALAATLRNPPQLVCRPQDYKDADVFGGAIWSLQDRSTPLRARIEDQLDFLLDYYEKQVDERHWYGFWYYGNVMHRYDLDRHVWRYDVGGTPGTIPSNPRMSGSGTASCGRAAPISSGSRKR